ncbi:restriction endonuclease [Dolosicoccus paucivorans]|uniref:Restriction endonuclease n=1 Tax=Dolosicoccus paucivorans TaxID=84521 RepID=A0A2N6SL24_9LACT|nr:DEAD/DEAH box helicase family protein [Dolosicoccus paucivorans]PMB83636.1 restriction endonuclease [Dolosicoccus paucivorans]PMC57774.1 restriction endonuclease [Dolosicoccus paucivorans]
MAKKKKLGLPLLESLQHFDISLENEFHGYEVPNYIFDNMKHHLRYYQETAFRYYHYVRSALQYKDQEINHVLFNMATGSGKTDLMASLILYLYQEHDYQQFIFTVNTNSVLKKTIDNLTAPTSEKYLYTQPLEIEGQRIRIEQVKQFPVFLQKNVIYLKLDTIQGIASDLFSEKENTMGIREYERHKTVILADEAHHYSASTKSEKETEHSWERSIEAILNVHQDNCLLEFTATIDLDNRNIYNKYKDKVLYRYALDSYIRDGYSKNIRRIQSSSTDLDNMMNVVLLSEFRRLYAKEFHGVQLKPVMLFKSPRIADSKEAEEKFHQLIEKLTAESVYDFISLRFNEDTRDYSETLYRTYHYFMQNKERLNEIVREMKRQFTPNRVINANTQNMLENEQYEVLNTLESPSNLYRVIFAVAKLTEGWDVLNLYDIVRISDTKNAKGTRNATNSEAQLIGRGARYYPFEMNEERSYTRRFEDESRDSLLLETLHYHTINEPQYLKNLVASLDDMDLPTGEDKQNPPHEIKVKPSFRRTDLYKKGNIYYNKTIQVDDTYYDNLSKYGIDNQSDIYIDWKLTTRELDYDSNMVKKDYSNVRHLPIQLDDRLIYKAFNRLSFYHFDQLKQFVPMLKTRSEFLNKEWLNFSTRTLYATAPKSFSSKDIIPQDKLEILEFYLLEVERKIRNGYQKSIGTNQFVGYPIKEYITNYNKRVPNYDTSRMRLLNDPAPQQVTYRTYKDDDFFIYDSAVINQTEAQLVDRIGDYVDQLKEQYGDVYLVRMDENMHRESAKNNRLKLYQFEENPKERPYEAFQPDFLLLLQQEDFFMQVFIEPKGINLLEKEQWKEDLLMYINDHEGELVFEDEVGDVKVKGVKFYTIQDGRGTIEQLGEITIGKPFKGLSYE